MDNPNRKSPNIDSPLITNEYEATIENFEIALGRYIKQTALNNVDKAEIPVC